MTSSSATDASPAKTLLNAEQILGLLPHRYPFALVDRVIDHVPGEKAIAIKNITLNEPQFQGHFPGRPLMPGVLIVEAMAQVGGLIVTQMPNPPQGLFVFAGIDGVRFFTRLKTVTTRWPKGIRAGADFIMPTMK